MANLRSAVIDLFKKYFTQGHERSVKAKKNIFFSFFIKGISIAISLVLVPLTINYVNPTRYGIWLTLSSIVGWFSFFDIGLTQGLRNKFAEAKAKGDYETAQVYVSTTYAVLTIIFILVWLIFLVVNQFLDWSKILNISPSMRPEVTILAVMIFTYFCINFVLRIITTLIVADQQPAKSTLIDVLGQVLTLLLIFILVKTTKGSLTLLGIVLCVSPIITITVANIIFFKREFARFRPMISKIKFKYAKDLFNLGVIFFVIQVTSIIQYQTANIIIAQNYGVKEVTSYNIVYKYFGVLLMVSTIFLAPFWSASTEAYFKDEIQWIKNGIKKYNQLNIVLVLGSIIMLALSGIVYRLWLGKGTVDIGFTLSFWGFVYFNVIIFGSKYVYFLNGINALRIQFISSLISPFLYVAVALILIKFYHLGMYSIFIASIIANVNAIVLAPIQYYQIINRNKKGIWIR
ncbi:MAG: MATE family efflux transporter [Bacteroidetes bacterium]|nr:MATE family efflux transporter [Bacteroidota bacterium]